MEKQAKVSPRAFRELGSTGLKVSGGVIVDDFLPQLRTIRQRVRTFEEMRMDPTVGAVLFAIEQFVRGSVWSVEASGESDEEKRDADFLRENMDGMSHTWSDFVNEALTMLPFGFSVAEICYKKGPDGSVRWKKMPFRAQETIWEWIFDENGGIKGLRQNLHWSV